MTLREVIDFLNSNDGIRNETHIPEKAFFFNKEKLPAYSVILDGRIYTYNAISRNLDRSRLYVNTIYPAELKTMETPFCYDASYRDTHTCYDIYRDTHRGALSIDEIESSDWEIIPKTFQLIANVKYQDKSLECSIQGYYELRDWIKHIVDLERSEYYSKRRTHKGFEPEQKNVSFKACLKTNVENKKISRCYNKILEEIIFLETYYYTDLSKFDILGNWIEKGCWGYKAFFEDYLQTEIAD